MANDSASSEVGARYARALLDLAVETGALEAVESDIAGLKAMLAESADLRALVVSPRFDAEEKAKALTAVAARAGASEITKKFLGLLAMNRRAAALPIVIDAFQRLAAARRGLTLAKVTTAVELTKAQAKNLAGALRAALGGDPQIETAVDPAILGGLKVRVGSRLFDASLKTKLDSLKFALKRA